MTSKPAPRSRESRSSRKPGSRPHRSRGRRLAVSAAGLAVLALAAGSYAWSRRVAVDPDQLWIAAQEALKVQRIDEAEGLANRLSRLRAPTPMDRMLLAQVDIARERTDEALANLAQIPDDHRMAAQARLMSGQLELRRRRLRFAERYYRQALALDPTLVKAHHELIYIYGYQLRRPELNAEFLALSKITDLSFDNVFHWCLMRTASWEPGPVIKDLTLYIEADPEDRWSKLALAENYHRMGLLAEAEAAIASLPDSDLDALAVRVMLAVDRHQQDEAERMLASGPPDYPPLARIRGRLALARRDAEAAVRNFRIAQADDPLNRDTVLGLANALTMLGDAQGRGAGPRNRPQARDPQHPHPAGRDRRRAEQSGADSRAGGRLRGPRRAPRGGRLVQGRHRQEPARHGIPAGPLPALGTGRAGPARIANSLISRKARVLRLDNPWLIAAVDDAGNWHFGIGDPTPMGWFILFAYMVATVLAGTAWVAEHKRRLDGRIASPKFWLVLTVLLLFLGINKQLDLQTLLQDTVRRMAKANRWYDNRRIYQAIFIALVVAAGVADAGDLLVAGPQAMEAEFRRPAGDGDPLCLRVHPRLVAPSRGHRAAVEVRRAEMELDPRARRDHRDDGRDDPCAASFARCGPWAGRDADDAMGPKRYSFERGVIVVNTDKRATLRDCSDVTRESCQPSSARGRFRVPAPSDWNRVRDEQAASVT